MPTIGCPHCKREIADQSKRCLYCGRLLAVTSEVEAQEDLRRTQRMVAIYEAGIGLRSRGRRGWIEELREASIAVKLLVATLMLPLMMFSPFRVLRSIKAIFEE